MTQRRYANSQAADLHAELVRRESQLRATLYGIGDAVIATDNSGRVTMLNPIAEKLTGWSETEAQGKPLEEIFRIVNEETRATVENPVARVVREGVVIGLASHTMLIARDGSEIPIADAGAPIWNADGTIAGVVLVFRDQSAERAAQRAVQAAREFAESIIATVREPLVALDADLRVVSANRAFYRVFQVTPAEIEGRLFYELGNRQWDIPALRRLLEDILPQNSHFDDYTVTHDFERIGTRTMLLNARRVHRADGKAELILLAIEDITERERTEQARRQSETRNRIISELVSDYAYIFRVTPEGELKGEWVTESFTKAFGLTLDGVRARGGWQGMVYPEDLAIARAHAQKVARGQTDVCEMRWVTVSGEVRWLRDYAKPILDETGRVAYIYGASQDITEHKRAEVTLRASEERYRALFENVPEIVYALAPDGRFTLLNPAFENITGWAAQDWLGQSFEELIHPDDRALARQEFQRALRGETRDFRELRLLAKSGETLVMEVLGVAQRQNGQVVSVSGFAHDITARKQAEQALRRFAQREEGLVALGRALAATLDLKSLYRAAHQHLQTLIDCPNFAISLFDQTTQTLRVAYLKTNNDEPEVALLPPLKFDAQQSSTGRSLAIATQKPAIVDDLIATARAKAITIGSEQLPDSAIYVPMIVEGKVLGLLELQSYRSHAYTPEDGEWLSVAANQIGLGIQNARLFEETRQRVAELAVLHAIASVCIQADDEDTLLTEVTHLIGDTLYPDSFGFLLMDQDGKHLVAHPSYHGITAENIPARISLQTGIAGRVAASGQAYRTGNVRAEPAYLEVSPATRSELRVPMTVGGRVIGVINAESHREDAFSQADERLLSTAAGQVATTLERIRLHRETQRRAHQLEVVHQVSTALRAAPSMEQALLILLDETLSVLGAEAGIIRLYDPSRDELRAAVARGWFREVSDTPISPGEGIAGSVFVSGQSHVSAEFSSDPLTRALTRERIPLGWGGACIPIRAEAAVVGVLFISVQLPRRITSEEVNLLESLAEMAGTTLHRLRLHDETLRRVQQLQTLQTIDRAIIAALDLRLTLNVLLEQSLSPLGVDAAGVLLLDPHSLMLEYAAGRGFRTRAYERSRLRLGEGLAGLAALERRMIHIDDLYRCEPPFTRLALLTSEQFICYTAVPLVAKGQLLGVLEAFHRSPMTHSEDWLNFFQTIARQGAIAIDNARLFENLQRSNVELSLAYDVTIEGWARALDLRDRETTDHTRRVTEMTLRLARAAGMSEEELVHIRRGAFLHDIGKMGVPDAILLKPGPLTDEEWMIMRQHPQYAYDMLASIAYLRPALDIPYCHHEKWDGTGYPRGLTGEAIPLAARIFAVADVWDALISDRPYRPAWSEDKARAYIRAQAGKHFDPQVVELFIQMVDEIINKRK